MASNDFEVTWQQINGEVLADMTAWRKAHPRATLQEIEQVVDQQLAATRARLLHQVAQDSPATDWHQAPPEDHPTCPDCGTRLRPNGTATRHLLTNGGQVVALDRSYGVCPDCGRGLFPPG